MAPAAGGGSGADDEGVLSMPKLVQDYFQGSGMSFQEYFQFPEMTKIRNPVHEYFRLGGGSSGGWIEEGTLPLEESEEGWVYLGAEHHELARIAVGRSGNRHYYAYQFGDSYIGPVLRTTAAVVTTGVYVAGSGVRLTGRALCGAASLVYTPKPFVPPPDAPLEERFVEQSVHVNGDEWWFRTWLPPDLEKVREEHGGLPVFLLLHGFKECGWDNWTQTKSGLAGYLMKKKKWAKWFPGIIVMPQLPRKPWDEELWRHWREPAMQQMALACLEAATQRYGADRARTYLVGESLGTEGAWYLAAAQPGIFAAVGGSCGSVEPYDWKNWQWQSAPGSYRELATSVGREVPLWFCHGAKDDFVPVEQSRNFLAALEEHRTAAASAMDAILGRAPRGAGEVVYKEYEDLDHHVWDRAYWEDGLIEWLLSKAKA